jgi:hypothetical protein
MRAGRRQRRPAPSPRGTRRAATTSFFQQVPGTRLFVASSGPADRGWLGYLVPPNVTPSDPGVDLETALTGTTLGGSFILSTATPDLGGAGALAAFIAALDGVIGNAPVPRVFAWLADPASVTDATTRLMGFSVQNGSAVTRSALQATIVQSLTFQVTSAVAITVDGDTLDLQGTGAFSFIGGASPQAQQISSATLPLTGPRRGCFQFATYIQRPSLNDDLGWGFQYLFPVTDPARDAIAEWLPFGAGYLPSAGDWLGFAATIDPADVFNAVFPGGDRTALVFTGENLDQSTTTVVSYFRTIFGDVVTLVPLPGPLDDVPNAARLVFNAGVVTAGQGQQFQVAPAGDFTLVVGGATAGESYALLCGLMGTEYIAFQPYVGGAGGYAGDRLRFASRCAAFAAGFPYGDASPVGAPYDPSAKLLDPKYLTSWATVVRAPAASGAIPYVAQPKGASLYGRDALIHASYATLFGSVDPSVVLSPGTVFPLAPYVGAQPGDGVSTFSASQIEEVERTVVAATRRAIIGAAAGHAPSAGAALGLIADDVAPFNTTTPSGLLVSVHGDGEWTKILLGQKLTPALQQLYFCAPDATLQQAFQTNQLFLVTANATHLGALAGAGDGTCGAGPAFHNRVDIGGWGLQANVGQNGYDDYANVMIVKARTGALYDPTSDATRAASLVANPDRWTQATDFAAPTDLVPNPAPPPAENLLPPNPNELVTLSFWLQRYFDQAAAQRGNSYFDTFNAIARDPSWTGILFLRVDIAQVPADLAGITAGIMARDRFNAHHLAVEISQVANDPLAPDIELEQTSSMFGLIYYVDPLVPAAQAAHPDPVPPPSGADYGFRVLTLKVQFANTAVQRFESYAQLTMNRLFGMPVTRMGTGGNPYNTIVLRGSYQDNGGDSVYSLTSTADNTFYFANDVFNKIELVGAQLSTRKTGDPATQQDVISWFALDGFLDFAIAQGADGSGKAVPFDVFSFGSNAGEDTLRAGLGFSSLGLQMRCPPGLPPSPSFSFVTSELRFDTATSAPRRGSLAEQFALQLGGLVTGTADATPANAGYLPVITDATFTGVDGGDWYGLSYRLNMGTPGDLAGDVGLTSQLLTAWSPKGASTGSYAALVGVQLPGTGGGAKLISLQTVLKLSIGQIRLAYDPAADAGKGGFLLMMTDIALKAFGVLKLPPNGSTLFYLFGNPQSDGKPSGLGWYAMYRTDAAKALATATAR